MRKLYTYCIPVDDGAAPNPYWGICTLAICKPKIRSKARVGDWIVGTGSKKSPLGDLSNKIVYAMEVTDVKSFQEYDRYTRRFLRQKMPNVGHHDRRRRLGDSIYDFSKVVPKQRLGVHSSGGKKQQKIDLGGKNVLLSKHFFYFGNKPIGLPKYLQPIVQQTQGHRVHKNNPFLVPFLRWLKSLRLKPNTLYGRPASQLSAHNCGVRSRAARKDAISCIVD